MTEIAHPAPATPGAGRRLGGHPLAWFVVKRVGAALLTLIAVSILVFAGTELLGDAASAILGRNATPESLAELRGLMGLDEPAIERYFDWLGGLLTGDLGNSASGYAQGGEIPIWDKVEGKLANSFTLAAITTIVMVPLSLLFGVWAALRAGRAADQGISVTSLAVISLPEFVLGSLLILFFFSWLDLLPPVALIPPGTSALSEPTKLILPVLTLLGVTCAASIRMVRAGMIETLAADYVQMARLNGFRERLVVSRYALRNALAPSVQVFAQNIQFLIGGIIVIEYLFAYPGLGKELVDAVCDPRRARGAVARDLHRRVLHRHQHHRRPARRAARAEAEDDPVTAAVLDRMRFLRIATGRGRARPARPRARHRPVRAVLRALHADRDDRDSVYRPERGGAARHGHPRPRRALARALGRAQRARPRRSGHADRLRRRRSRRSRRRLQPLARWTRC